MVRDLLLWMDDIIRQMNTQEKPRDVSGVELLMNNHHSLKAEIDAREENFAICINLGRDLLDRKHYRIDEVREKLILLTTQRQGMVEQWNERWEYLELILEVYQFARDAAVAEAWLMGQEPYLNNQDLGDTLDAVENLIKKHEAFEKSAATQEERFAALEKMTNFEIKERLRLEADEYKRQHPDEVEREREERRRELIKDFLPPEEPPTPEPVSEPEQPSPEERAAEEAEVIVNGEKEPELEQGLLSSLTYEQLKGVPSRSQRDDKPGAREPTSPRSPGYTPQKGEMEKKEKKRSRSKSPFGKIFSRKKAEEYRIPGEVQAATSSDEVLHEEGILTRKHEWEATTKKASNRSWDKVYAVLHGNSLSCYKDQKHAKQDPHTRVHHETPIDLTGGTCERATDYTKRPHVFRLKITNGGEYLFQAKDESEMDFWIQRIQQVSGVEGTSMPSKSQTLPAKSEEKRDEHKKKSFFTLKKK
ncbi:hypothetical protein ScPMuIL_014049 [Solemya velum]